MCECFYSHDFVAQFTGDNAAEGALSDDMIVELEVLYLGNVIQYKIWCEILEEHGSLSTCKVPT